MQSVRDSGLQKFLFEESGIQKTPAKNPWLTAWNLESNTVLDSLSWGSWGESFYFHNKYLNKGALPDSGCHLNLDLVASFHSFQITGNLEARQGTVIFAWLRKKTNVSYRSKRQQRSKFKSGYCDWHSKLKAVKGRETGCQWNAGSKSILFFKECCFRVRVRVDTNPYPNPNLNPTLKRQNDRPRPQPRPRVLLTPHEMWIDARLARWFWSRERMLQCDYCYGGH